MKRVYERALGLCELKRGPVDSRILDWPLNAVLFDIVDEGPCIRIAIAVYTTFPYIGWTVFERRIWDPDYRPGCSLAPRDIRSINGALNGNQKNLDLWGKILGMEPRAAYAAMKTGSILNCLTILLTVEVSKGANGEQYYIVIGHKVMSGTDGMPYPVTTPVHETLPRRHEGSNEIDTWYAEWEYTSPSTPAPVLNDWLINMNKRNSTDYQNMIKEKTPTRPGERVASMI